MEQPSIGLLHSITAGFTEQTVKPGSIISFSVQRKIGEHNWVVRMLGREVRVVSDLQLEVGARLKATVQLESGKLLLKIDRQAHALNNILQTSNLPDTQTSRMLIQAFMAQGLPLREERLRAALKLFSQLDVKDSATSRLIAVVYDKGLFLTPDQMKRMQILVFGDDQGRRDGGSAHQEQHPGQEQQHDGQEQQQGRRRGRRQSQNPDQIQNRIERDLRTQITARGSGAPLLHLFNHTQGQHKNWIVIPLAFNTAPAAGRTQQPDQDLGILRLQLDSDGSPLLFTLTFMLYRESEPSTWHFSGKITHPKSIIHVYRGTREQGRPSAEILAKLHKKLNNLTFEIDDTIREAAEFDPFGPEDISSLKRVDTTA